MKFIYLYSIIYTEDYTMIFYIYSLIISKFSAINGE